MQALPEASITDAPTAEISPAAPPLPPTPSPVVALMEQFNLEEPIPAQPPPTENPLEFTFPTSGPEPVSLWRPPLYPTPWEPTPHDHFYLTRPIGADDVNWPLAKYRYGYLLYSEPHTGIDIPAKKGTPIMAAGPGTVTHAGWGIYKVNDIYNDPYGIAVQIKHDFGYKGKVLYTVYGHMDQVFVYPGQHVEGGEVIGVVGETGNVSGPHLHFEVRLGDYTFFATRNPELWIAPPQGWGVLVGRLTESNGRRIPQAKARLVSKSTKRIYEVIGYAEGSIRSDDYYEENLVLGDLPAGGYTLYLDAEGESTKIELEIRPGQVTFFNYRLKWGFDFSLPPEKGTKFVPPDVTQTSGESEVVPTP